MALHDFAKKRFMNLKVLSETELNNLHEVLCIILDDLIKICQTNNLHFILIGGSAIGALRSGGFIPWDDDIDIAMTRSDFNKLIKIINTEYKEKYSILDPRSSKNYGRVLPKLRLKGTCYKTILEYDLDECGIFIDVYIIENIPNNIITRYFQGIVCLFLGLCLASRRVYKGRKYFKSFDKSFSFKVKICLGCLLNFITIEKWAQWTDYWNSKCKDDTSRLVSIPTDDFHFFGETYKRDQLCTYKNVSFEGKECFVPMNYDSYLRRRYGNYMLPPASDKHERNSYLSYDLGKYIEGK